MVKRRVGAIVSIYEHELEWRPAFVVAMGLRWSACFKG